MLSHFNKHKQRLRRLRMTAAILGQYYRNNGLLQSTLDLPSSCLYARPVEEQCCSTRSKSGGVSFVQIMVCKYLSSAHHIQRPRPKLKSDSDDATEWKS